MDLTDSLPEALKQIGHSLEPYIKQRNEVERVRRILAANLSTHINPKASKLASRPLSLVHLASSPEPPTSSKGIGKARREYVRAAKANIIARQEYNNLTNEHHSPTIPESQNVGAENASGFTLDSFLAVVRYRRKHERLRIIQDYVDGLAQKPAAAIEHLDPRVVMLEVGSLPKVPQEVMDGSSGTRQYREKTDLKGLVDQLEQSVLRAKLVLKREQNLLAKLKAEGPSGPSQSGSKLQALGTTRNELIHWIETELAKTGETHEPDESNGAKAPEQGGKDYIERQLNSIQRQYSLYNTARQALLAAATGTPEPPEILPVDEEPEDGPEVDKLADQEILSHVIHPYLEELSAISNEQKSIIQQKSHLTISLSKQLKEANQGLDRQAGESHLLSAYPMSPLPPRAKGGLSFGEEIVSHEKPDSSRQAKAWVFACNAAHKNTNEDVTERLDEGSLSLQDARETMAELQRLLGDEEGGATKDIWAMLEGNLGVIKSDD